MAILYDYLEVVGGAESFTIDLANKTKQTIIVAGVNETIIEKLPKIENNLTQLSTLTSIPLWKSIKAMHAFRFINENHLQDPVNLFSGNNAPLAVYNSSAQKNYYYCHTPPRFVYDLYDYYQKNLPWYQKKVVDVFAKYVKSQYEPAIHQMDKIFCNSKNVQSRIAKFLDCEAEVIYPPIATQKYFNKPSNGFYLSTARLEDYKRVEIIVDAFLQMPDKHLVVVSGGTLLEVLRKKTAEAININIVGWVTEDVLLNYIAECIATIYLPIDEDFGMSPVESMAAGKPVIGVNDGGLKETILHQQTGWLCPASLTIEHIIDAVNFMSVNTANSMKKACFIQASSFSSDIFYQRMNEIFLNR
ncbi:glycosyltransferase [Thalassotalea piscium]